MNGADQSRLFADDAPGLALQLRDAARALGHATLAIRSGQTEAALVLIRRALQSLTVAESGLPVREGDR